MAKRGSLEPRGLGESRGPEGRALAVFAVAIAVMAAGAASCTATGTDPALFTPAQPADMCSRWTAAVDDPEASAALILYAEEFAVCRYTSPMAGADCMLFLDASHRLVDVVCRPLRADDGPPQVPPVPGSGL